MPSDRWPAGKTDIARNEEQNWGTSKGTRLPPKPFQDDGGREVEPEHGERLEPDRVSREEDFGTNDAPTKPPDRRPL